MDDCPECGGKAEHSAVDAVGWYRHRPNCSQMTMGRQPPSSQAATAMDDGEAWQALEEVREHLVRLRDRANDIASHVTLVLASPALQKAREHAAAKAKSRPKT